MEVLWILIPGVFVGFAVMESVRRIFSEDDQLLKKIFSEQPVTMIAAAGIIGSVVMWGVLSILRIW